MVALLSIGLRDDVGKVSHFKVHGLELTSGNIVAQLADAAALQAAVEGLSLGAFASRSIDTDRAASGNLSTTHGCNLGDKWIITAQDAGGNLYTYSIPAEDDAAGANLLAGSHIADDTATPVAAFITAFNAYAVNRLGNAVTYVRMRLGTRLGT
jgi:hypothetical protein